MNYQNKHTLIGHARAHVGHGPAHSALACRADVAGFAEFQNQLQALNPHGHQAASRANAN